MVIVAGSALQLSPQTVKELGIEVVNYRPFPLGGYFFYGVDLE